MSWIEFLGEAWHANDIDAKLHLHLWPPFAHCPRRSWSISLKHYDHDRTQERRDFTRWLTFEIGNLHFHEPDWRRLAGLEIRADAAWHTRHEHFHEYGRLVSATASVSASYLGNSPGNPTPVGQRQSWQGHDFTLRLGQRDGFFFPCEIDAWLLPGEEYARTTPETPEQLRRFGEGPPDLRIIARAHFTSGTVVVPRSDDPVSLARAYLRDQIALEEIHEPQLQWMTRRPPGAEKSEPMPGWGSTVTFRTAPLAGSS